MNALIGIATIFLDSFVAFLHHYNIVIYSYLYYSNLVALGTHIWTSLIPYKDFYRTCLISTKNASANSSSLANVKCTFVVAVFAIIEV